MDVPDLHRLIGFDRQIARKSTIHHKPTKEGTYTTSVPSHAGRYLLASLSLSPQFHFHSLGTHAISVSRTSRGLAEPPSSDCLVHVQIFKISPRLPLQICPLPWPCRTPAYVPPLLSSDVPDATPAMS